MKKINQNFKIITPKKASKIKGGAWLKSFICFNKNSIKTNETDNSYTPSDRDNKYDIKR